MTNETDLVDRIASAVETFGCAYLINRLRDKNLLTARVLRSAAVHIAGASREIAIVFVRALAFSQQHGGVRIEVHPPIPAASPPGPANFTLARMADALDLGDGILPGVEDVLRRLNPF